MSSSSISCTKLALFTIAGISIQFIGLSIFVYGFFPIKPALSGHSGTESFRSPPCSSMQNKSERDLPPDKLKLLYQDLSGIPPSFDRLILMVIDGLPAEFVLGKDDRLLNMEFVKAMSYTQSLVRNGTAIGYHAKAAPPTVTMPRLKAMVSGAIPGFLDVAFNFNTQAFLDDNLLGQFLKVGWKMVMHGDETWLKLFPGLFSRHDGVSSFFVKDTVQVDKNVSRHLEDELNRDDWSLLILHYLGLDHVGHIGGRNSVLMAPKLAEMDEVVKTIHTSAIMNEKNERRTLLVVVSDHGMTDNGNHGGSSYEETDSLFLLIGLRDHVSDYASSTSNKVNQVDIVPTLALLFGVPIPKNNVGFMISETFDSLKDTQQLRALQLNSWQLLRLLQAQLPGLPCRNFPCDGFIDNQRSPVCKKDGSEEKKLCCLYLNAMTLHSLWISSGASKSKKGDCSHVIEAYYEFLKTASEWLSHRATDKPVKLLAFGVAAMLLSCFILLTIIHHMYHESCISKKQSVDLSNTMHTWHLDGMFALAVILLASISMVSSSMVEEEQYIWHFLITTLTLLLLRKSMQCLPLFNENNISVLTICSILVLLISGRILRGWHQGGVNYTHLPDICKWLEQAGTGFIHGIQLVSGLLILGLSLFTLSFSRTKRKIILVIGFIFLVSGLLVFHHVMEYQDTLFKSFSYSSTILAQIIYAILGIGAIGIVLVVPWIIPIQAFVSISSPKIQDMYPVEELKDSTYIIGCAYIVSFSLLQFFLQQPINSAPTLLLLVQILAVLLLYFHNSGPNQNRWTEVAVLYYMGMAGHFALGNSNSLATIDVAGAFIGISNYSTLLSGILMFIITYASPLLFLLSTVIYISIKDTSYVVASVLSLDSGQILKTMLGFPCLVPLGVNSILLTSYTLVLLLMRNHLFIWSVFSPKYLYICATTVCVYVGISIVAATVIYAYTVLASRKRTQISSKI